jgi:hypothetical protein
MSLPNYVLMITRLYETGAIKQGEASSVRVQHDDWCAIYRGLPCQCNPNISVGARVYRYADVMEMN